MTYDIAHITLTTGDVAKQGREAIVDTTLAIVGSWLTSALVSGKPEPIPGIKSGNAALALQQDGALVVTVYGPTPDVGKADALVTFGVATHSMHANNLWSMLLQTQPYIRKDLQQPCMPWCAVVPYPNLLNHTDAAAWIADFERCVAWAWASRNPELRGI
ncbi:hypothetical protein [Xanthomonas albilineans]|uniref:Uncharacterized protein n=1 Tax=Xanthomonas albilineans (strain GPE PC73 / CFBP 7063) TaxID=380358 RepID=D2UAM8_XANAP|nr:hypothetical protein [Xanthomonas albilineans]CBA14785.1 hypothetical protein XALC_0240 [Xanthomonas albilineans GPE PC73]